LSNRREFIKGIIAGGAVLALNTIPFRLFSDSEKEVTKITILHTNDTHSRIEPFPVDDKRFPGMGGFAQRAAYINKVRSEEKNVLVFDAGDTFQGTPYFNKYGGELEFKLMTAMGYDAATMGNHELDNGIEGFKKQLKFTGFPFVVSNYDFSETVLNGQIKKYTTFKHENIKIGVFGLGIELDGLISEKHIGKIRYLDPVSVTKEIESTLKEREKCDLIICLSHLGYSYSNGKISDIDIAKNSTYVDMIIGGHTHTFLEEADKISNRINQDVLVVQVGHSGVKIGRIDYYFNKRTKKIARTNNNVFLIKNQV
jgi:5'-nucleotidase